MKCKICKKEFKPKNTQQKTCGHETCKKAWEKEYHKSYDANRVRKKLTEEQKKKKREYYARMKTDSDWYKNKTILTEEQKEKKRKYNRERYQKMKKST